MSTMGAAEAEVKLAERAAAGDAAAFGELYERHHRRMFGLAYRITGSADDAADATQDAFVKLLEKLPRGGRVRDFASYALTVTRNAGYDLIARRARAEPVEEVPEPRGAEPPPPEQDPERAALLDDVRDRVERANRRLEPRHREVLALREAEGLSYDEIAATMGMNRNAVAQLLLRARTALRRELRRGAVESIAAAGPECERALPLVCAREDGEGPAGEEAQWLRAHLAGCDRCRLAAEELAEVGRSYRAWAPVPAAAGLKELVFDRVSEAFGFGWDAASAGTAASPSGAASGASGSGATGSPAGAASATTTTTTRLPFVAHRATFVVGAVGAGVAVTAVTAVVVALLVGGGSGGDDGPAAGEPASARPVVEQAKARRKAAARKRARRAAKRRAARRRAARERAARRAKARAERSASQSAPTAPPPAPEAAPEPAPAPPPQPAPSPAPKSQPQTRSQPAPAPPPPEAPELEVTPE